MRQALHDYHSACFTDLRRGMKRDADPPLLSRPALSLYSCNKQSPELCCGSCGPPLDTHGWPWGCQWLWMQAPATLGPALSSRHLPGYLGHRAFGHPPPGKRCPLYHHLSLIVSGLEDAPHGAISHRHIMLACASPDLQPSVGTAIFSSLAKGWTSSCYCGVFFFFPHSVLELDTVWYDLTRPSWGFPE